jgi:hypothetical protein
MMATSIEIFVRGADQLLLSNVGSPFLVFTSHPARSHRGESSLWQQEFEKGEGVLVHVGDPDMLDRDQLFWAYDILDEISTSRYRFARQYEVAFFDLLRTLLVQSPIKQVLFTSDSQFGPKPYKFKRSYSLEAAKRIHDKQGFKLNSAMQVSGLQ